MPKVSEERSTAARVAGCAELRDVRLFGVEAGLDTPPGDGSLSYTLGNRIEFQTLGEPVETVIVTGRYELQVLESTGEGDDEEEPTTVTELEFTLAALFQVPEPSDDNPEPFADEEFEAFAATTGQFALYPYAREFIADMTGRMGLPPLHIGTLRLQLDSREG